jgi:O-antigen ligase
VIALAPLASLSRGALIIGVGSIVVALLIVLKFSQRVKAGSLVGIAAVLLGSLVIGAYVEWEHLGKRFRQESVDSGRQEIWQNTWKIFREYPVYGTGPGTFESVYLLYRPATKDEWQAYAHCDWLELLATFGVVGTLLVLAALGVAMAHPFFGERIRASRAFTPLLYLAMASCLAFAVVDFPFVIYSILFLFVLVCALLTCMSQRT